MSQSFASKCIIAESSLRSDASAAVFAIVAKRSRMPCHWHDLSPSHDAWLPTLSLNCCWGACSPRPGASSHASSLFCCEGSRVANRLYVVNDVSMAARWLESSNQLYTRHLQLSIFLDFSNALEGFIFHSTTIAWIEASNSFTIDGLFLQHLHFWNFEASLRLYSYHCQIWKMISSPISLTLAKSDTVVKQPNYSLWCYNYPQISL